MMEKKEMLDLCANALLKYGNEAQTFMLFEESAELNNALAKYKRGRCSKEDVITELADVSIMIEQMAILFGYDAFDKEKDRKLTRLKEKLNGNNFK